MVFQDNRLRRGTARGSRRDRLAREDQADAAQLDRKVRRRRDRVQDRERRQLQGLHHDARTRSSASPTWCLPLSMSLWTSSRRPAERGRERYKFQSAMTTEIDRMSTVREKTGLFLEATPSTRLPERKSRFISPTMCWCPTAPARVMGVPAHDERDFEFAKNMAFP